MTVSPSLEIWSVTVDPNVGRELTAQLEIIHEYIEERGTDRITWIIIWLIVVACLVEVVRDYSSSLVAQGEVVARLVFHAIPRDKGEFLLVKGSKAIVGALRR
jgi:hypothetical protein